MGTVVFDIVKAPMGWTLLCDRVRVGGLYATKEAALEVAVVAATITVRDGSGIQINAPSQRDPNERQENEDWPVSWDTLLKRKGD